MAKILLVEDDKSLREIYGVRLMAEGYEIVSAGDGEEALAMAIKERPDLIVSDVMMPKISGFDMLDILRSTSETKDVKVIMMTALSSDDQRARGESLGADRYLVKSQVGIEDVVRTVHDVLGDGIGAPAPAAPAIAPAATPVDPAAPTTPAPAVPDPVAPAADFAQAPMTDPLAAPAPVVPDPVATAAPADPSATPAPADAYAPVAPVATPDPLATAPAPVAPEPTPAPAADLIAPVEPAPAAAVDPLAGAIPAAPVDAYAAPAPAAPVQEAAPEPAADLVPPATQPAPAAAPAPASTTLSELPANPAPAPAAPLPQPTAPFSSPAPASLGDRVIQPLTMTTDPNAPAADIATQMAQALGGTPASPADNQQPPLPPAQ